MDATQCPIETARQALDQSEYEIAETLIENVLVAVPSFKTFAELSAFYRSLGMFVQQYGRHVAIEGGVGGLFAVEDDVRDAAWKRAEELALAEMPEALRAIVTEMGFAEGTTYHTINPTIARSLEEYLDGRSPARNPKLGDKLMKRLIALPFGVEHTELAGAVARFLNKGRNTTPHGDPLVEAFRKAVKKRSQEAKEEPPAKRSHNAE
jgi:hypothetical protein